MNNKKFTVLIVALLVIFFLVRLPGISLPYHQDEWKNVHASSNTIIAGEFFAHPPLMQMILVAGYKIFGENNYRFFPLIFSLASAFLLYVVVRNRSGKSVAAWSLFIFSLLFYNILGSLVPDVDGAILPFFLLLSIFFYDKWNSAPDLAKRKWFLLLFTSLLIGFLIKLSFILVVGAIIADYILNNWRILFSKVGLKKAGYAILSIGFFGAVYVGLLYLIKYTYPPFDMSIMLGHANQFSDGAGRNWIQIVVQGIKAVFYLSPLALVPLIFISKEILKKTRIFSLYLFFGLIFYFVVFDFSRGALDKYIMFAIVPLSVIVGSVFAEIFGRKKSAIDEQEIEEGYGKSSKKWWVATVIVGIIASIGLLSLNFLPSEVLPLYPKTLWFSRILHGNWVILNPFNGGSGPLGFYVSFIFIAVSFILSTLIALLGFWKKEWRASIVLILLFIGISYNTVFAEELFFGKINGSAPAALRGSVDFIRGRPDIKKVITYNDIGAGPLENIGKYSGRIYATPQSEDTYKTIFAKHISEGGHFLVVGVPPLGPETFYGKFFGGCDSLYKTISGRIEANVYTCKTAKPKNNQ